MDRRSFVTGIAVVPIASTLPAASAPDPWTVEYRLIARIGRTTVERHRLRQAGASAATMAAIDCRCQRAVRAYGRFLDGHRRADG